MSPRPKKPRHCACPHRPEGSYVYKPSGRPMRDLQVVTLLPDELEALRLCDGEGLTQLQAGACMGISRGTVQRLVVSGRNKVATALSSGQAIVVASLASLEQPAEGSEDV